MFVNDIVPPNNLLEAQALKRRLPNNHEKMAEIEKNLRIYHSGFQGEKTLHYYLGLLPEKKYYIFHGLRLPIKNSYFQIDFLLISTKLILILDSKNNSGTITIDKLQMTQEYKDAKETYQNPVSQVNRHKILLKYFFEKYQMPDMPIENQVVFTKSTSTVIIAPGYHEGDKKVCKVFDVLKRIQDIEKYHTKDIIDQKSIVKIKKLLLSKHTPLKGELKKELGIKKSDIKSGVICPNCLFMPLAFKRQKWTCPHCSITFHDAHVQAVMDYFLLINPVINNKDLRQFLHIPTARAATYLISMLNLHPSGNTKDRRYLPPKNYLQ